MRTWTRAEVEIRCGRCTHTIYVDQPMLVIQLPAGTKKFRCMDCAQEPVPDTLPAPPDRTRLVTEAILETQRRLTGAGQPSLDLEEGA